MLKKLFGENKNEVNEIDELVQEIRNCEFLLARNDILFNMTADEDLIESQIYEREALRSQYNYLIKRFKEKDAKKEYCLQTIKTGE